MTTKTFFYEQLNDLQRAYVDDFFLDGDPQAFVYILNGDKVVSRSRITTSSKP